MQTYIPAALLSPYIWRYIIIESHDERVNRVLPNTSLTMAFRFKGEVSYLEGDNRECLPPAVISGLQKTVRLIHYAQDSATVLVLFRETAPAAFFRLPLHELFGKSMALDHLIRQKYLSILQEQLAGASNNKERIARVERFLLSLLLQPVNDPLITAAVQHIYAAKGIVKAKALAGRFHLSQDAFEKRFRKTTGSSPKQFANLVRMKTAVSFAQQEQPFTGIALDSGFFDQSHFNKEFKLFTGQTPTDFRKSGSFW